MRLFSTVLPSLAVVHVSLSLSPVLAASAKQEWVHRFDETDAGVDTPVALALDRLGDAYVTGYSRRDEKIRHYVTVKYDAGGPKEWARRYLWQGYEEASALAVDRYLNVAVTGVSEFPYADHRLITLKYSQY